MTGAPARDIVGTDSIVAVPLVLCRVAGQSTVVNRDRDCAAIHEMAFFVPADRAALRRGERADPNAGPGNRKCRQEQPRRKSTIPPPCRGGERRCDEERNRYAGPEVVRHLDSRICRGRVLRGAATLISGPPQRQTAGRGAPCSPQLRAPVTRCPPCRSRDS